jgi:hypothetical protein
VGQHTSSAADSNISFDQGKPQFMQFLLKYTVELMLYCLCMLMYCALRIEMLDDDDSSCIVVLFLIILVPCSIYFYRLDVQCLVLLDISRRSGRSHSRVGPPLFTLVAIMDMLE